MKILLIEDNPAITKGLTYTLEKATHNITTTTTIKDAKTHINENHNIDLIILDICLPDGNGMTLYENTIKPKNIKTIFLTAKDDEDDIVRGLELGAEDYITKPFSTKELIARINKIFKNQTNQNTIEIKEIKFDMDKMEVWKKGEKIKLTSLELKLLNLLLTNQNKVVTKNTILDKIWEWTGNDVQDHTITVYFKRIREKLENDIITTVKGIGYRIDYEK